MTPKKRGKTAGVSSDPMKEFSEKYLAQLRKEQAEAEAESAEEAEDGHR
jgi:hypothetical protein